MADYHKIHPVSLDTPAPSAPAAPSNFSKPNISKTTNRASELPVHTDVARHARPPKRRSCCCRFMCWTLLAVVIVIVVLAATVGILYLVFDPKIPKFTVDRLVVTSFAVDANLTVHDSFEVAVTAHNPNKHIGIYYDDGSSVTAWYNDTELCSGAFPTFYQGHKNTTVLNITLAGETKLDGTLIAELQRQEQAGYVPLTVWAHVPVRIKFGAIRLPKMTGKAHCSLVVDSLKANNRIGIRSNSCKFKLKL